MKTGAVIVAAGLSSRMKDFKPMLALGENDICEDSTDEKRPAHSTMIRTAMRTLYRAGVEQIVVVTGRDAPLLVKHLSDWPVQCVYNEDYENSDMFASACMGFSALREETEGVFFLPVDVPLFAGSTLGLLQEFMECADCDILNPLCDGKKGHPVLIRKNIIPELLKFTGGGGLRGAIDSLDCRKETVETRDKGTVMDADHPEDYERLKEYACSRKDGVQDRIPDYKECMNLLKTAGTPDTVVEHCLAVSETAAALAHRLNLLGGPRLNVARLGAAGLLHDIDRAQSDHAVVGAARLTQAGYQCLAYLVGQHMELLPERAGLNEASLLWLADKCCEGSRLVSPAERFAAKEKRYAETPSALERVKRNRQIERIITERWQEITGETFSDTIIRLSEAKEQEGKEEE